MNARARLALLIMVALTVLYGFAAARAGAGGKIGIQLTQVMATEENAPGAKQFDATLSELKPQLENFRYRVYKNAGQEKKDVADGQEALFRLSEEGFTLHVTPGAAGDHVSLDLQIKDPKGKDILSTRIKIKDGGTGIVGKELEKKTGRLFLAFTVKKS